MKTLFLALTLGLGALLASAQDADEPLLTPSELETLAQPIALHPDSLVALILPATTESADVVLAARFLRTGGSPTFADAQDWDESVRALSRYPEIILWMDDELLWTRRMGEAFVRQPAEVLQAIQRLRRQAYALGNLTSSKEQRIVITADEIRILPVEEEVIYIPRYDYRVIYVERRPSHHVWLGFSAGFAAGHWLTYDLDWHRHCVRVGSPPPRYRPHASAWNPPVKVWAPRSHHWKRQEPQRPRSDAWAHHPERDRRPPETRERRPDRTPTRTALGDRNERERRQRPTPVAQTPHRSTSSASLATITVDNPRTYQTQRPRHEAAPAPRVEVRPPRQEAPPPRSPAVENRPVAAPRAPVAPALDPQPRVAPAQNPRSERTDSENRSGREGRERREANAR